MNIVFITEYKVDSEKGGVQRLTETLAKKFIVDGNNCIYLTFENGITETINGVKQLYFPNHDKFYCAENITYLKKIVKDYNVKTIINQSGLKVQIIKLLIKANEKNYKVISVHHNSVETLNRNYEQIVRENYGKKNFFKFIDNQIVWKFAKLYNIIKYGYYFRYAIKHSDYFVLYFKSYIEELKLYHALIQKNKIKIIPNPLPFKIEAIDGSVKKNNLLYVGRINYQQKRTDLLIDIWQKISEKYPYWEFHIVGDGEKRLELINRANSLGLKNIYFHGYINPQFEFRNAKIFCMTSAFEGHPMVILEANAFGVVPVAFDTFSGINEIIKHGESGFITVPYNIDEYCEYIETLIINEEMRTSMANKAQQNLHPYKVEIVVQLWYKLFQ
jgi:glycosyltransferase involved in cell wall biosynthesis